MSILGILFGFQGRITRAQYWLGALAPLFIIALIIFGSASAMYSLYQSGQTGLMAAAGVLGGLILPVLLGLIACIWISAALYTKRLHDRGKGAIWLLAIYIPAILPLLSIIYAKETMLFTYAISMISSLWIFIELGCMRGIDGPNRFDGDYTPTPRHDPVVGSWETPSQGGSQNLGGMAAAMAAINAAARDHRPEATQSSNQRGGASATQFGQRAPTQFGCLNAGATSGGFGRKV